MWADWTRVHKTILLVVAVIVVIVVVIVASDKTCIANKIVITLIQMSLSTILICLFTYLPLQPNRQHTRHTILGILHYTTKHNEERILHTNHTYHETIRLGQL